MRFRWRVPELSARLGSARVGVVCRCGRGRVAQGSAGCMHGTPSPRRPVGRRVSARGNLMRGSCGPGCVRECGWCGVCDRLQALSRPTGGCLNMAIDGDQQVDETRTGCRSTRVFQNMLNHPEGGAPTLPDPTRSYAQRYAPQRVRTPRHLADGTNPCGPDRPPQEHSLMVTGTGHGFGRVTSACSTSPPPLLAAVTATSGAQVCDRTR